LVANALWELALAAIKSFVVLWLTAGLGYPLSQTSAIIGAVALVILVAAALSGKLADRYGRVRIIRIALWVYGVGLLVPLLNATPLLIVPAIPLIAFGGGVTMTLPYALLMPIMPPEQHGSVTGLYSISRGVGIMLGPVSRAWQSNSDPVLSPARTDTPRCGWSPRPPFWAPYNCSRGSQLGAPRRSRARTRLADSAPPGAFSSVRRGAVPGGSGSRRR
jgi:MFS family permease